MPKYLLTSETAELLRTPIGTLHAWRSKGIGPPARRVGRKLLYDEAEVLAWVDAQADRSGAA